MVPYLVSFALLLLKVVSVPKLPYPRVVEGGYETEIIKHLCLEKFDQKFLLHAWNDEISGKHGVFIGQFYSLLPYTTPIYQMLG